MRTARAGRWAGLLGLLALLVVPPAATADDVPETARKKYEEARALYLKGDEKSLAAAHSALSEVKVRAPESADFWELFVRVWRAAKKPEADLWQKVVAQREAATPKSPVFDIVRARLEPDPAKKGEHFQKAVDKDPKAAGTRLLLAAHLRAQGEEIKAEELIEKVLADHPGHEGALVAKLELMLESGLSKSAVALAKEELAKKDCPALRHVLALALRRQAQEDPAKRAEALEAARKAVEGRPDPAYVGTYADLLEESDRASEAVTVLKTHFDKGGDARLGRRLGALAFRAGDYDAAVKSLAASASSDVRAAKALALAHARRGRAREAKSALEKVLALDAGAHGFAAQVELLLTDTTAARKRLEGKADDLSKALLLRADTLDGRGPQAALAAGPAAGEGTSRAEEDLLLAVVEARLFARLGPKAGVLRRSFVDVRAQVAHTVVPEAKPGPAQLDLTTTNDGYMERAVSYLRSACGTVFKPTGRDMVMSFDSDGMHIGFGVLAEATCARDPARKVRFNQQVVKEGDNVRIGPAGDSDGWKKAQDAFTAGCKALLAEDAPKAAEAFAQAVDHEPHWHRAKLLRSVARGLMPGSDLATAAREGLDAVSGAADDWEARELAIVLATWAGVDAAEALRSLQRHVEERSPRRLEDL